MKIIDKAKELGTNAKNKVEDFLWEHDTEIVGFITGAGLAAGMWIAGVFAGEQYGRKEGYEEGFNLGHALGSAEQAREDYDKLIGTNSTGNETEIFRF